MTKFLLSAILLTSFSNIFAFTTQGNWRWRKDDGSQTTATWIAAQNTTPVISSASDALRLRVELFNDAANPGGLLDGALFEDSSNAPGAHWDTLKLVSDGDDPFILAGSSTNVADLQVTTQQLTASHSVAFAPGKVIVSSEKLPASTIGDNTGTEYEYVIKPTANFQPSVTYYFRVDAANYPEAIPLPSLTAASVLPVSLVDFTIKKEESKIKLTWSVTSEHNNDRFEVERSSDGRDWITIDQVNGSGTSNQNHSYYAYDEKPFDGINYYRLKQYDNDGHFTVSVIRSLRLDQRMNAIVSVSPNPAKGPVSFKLVNVHALNVSAVLSDANGKVIHHEVFKEVQENSMNKLNLKQQPAPGMYILKLKAQGLSESVKIVVQ